jgi:signal transduction histidine kinase
VLALIPAFLLAYYRGWVRVSRLLGLGMTTLALLHILALFVGKPFGTFPLVLFLVAPYVAIALGAGWFGEVRRSATKVRAMQMQLIQAEKLESMGRMAAGVAHEVKNPLMTMLTGIRLLSRRLADADDSTQQVLYDMNDAVSRANTIVGALLSYSRQQELKLTCVDLNAVVGRALALIPHELDGRRIRVVKDLASTLPRMMIDELKIQQVLIAVCSNAVQAMGDIGTLTVRTSTRTLASGSNVGLRQADRYRPGDRVVTVEVEDTGPGLAPEHLDKVFDPFFTTKPTGVGTGLGLSVSRQIVEMHGGTIDLVNRDTHGARVTITFALRKMEQPDDVPARLAS